MHGDGVIDVETGCDILSADTIVEVSSLALASFVVHHCEKFHTLVPLSPSSIGTGVKTGKVMAGYGRGVVYYP